MIIRAVRIQLMVFLLITVVGVAFVGARYAQIDQLIVDDDYTVSASFAESGGIFTGAEVTYRGQPVGRVGQLKLLSDGVDVNLVIEKKFKIPNDLMAVVANRSASEAGALTSLDGKPLIVLTAEQGNAPGWIEKQAAIAALSTNSQHVVVRGATHQSLVDNPTDAAVVSQAIVDVVEATRTGAPLPTR